MELSGKRVLVTGGALRVGREISKAFARAGAKIVIHYRDSEKEAQQLVEELGGAEAGHSCIRFDLSDPSSLPDLGQLDVLINNASLFLQRKLSEEQLADAKRQFDVNFFAPMELVKRFAAQPGDNELAVVNILDQRICKTDSQSFSYALSKKALAEATLAAALQLAPRVRVNGLAPGPVFPPKGMENSKMRKTLESIPLHKAVSPQDLAEACVFLASNSSIAGALLPVDCGQHLL